jgi:hypothetical protein
MTTYKGGPSPFKGYAYDDAITVSQNIGFNQPKRLNKSYDKHVEQCFGLTENRNKKSLKHFKRDVGKLADSVILRSYRFKDPAYIFLKEINGELTAVIVNATDGEYITTINPTSGQRENLELTKNIGLDTRSSMELRLRGPQSKRPY